MLTEAIKRVNTSLSSYVPGALAEPRSWGSVIAARVVGRVRLPGAGDWGSLLLLVASLSSSLLCFGQFGLLAVCQQILVIERFLMRKRRKCRSGFFNPQYHHFFPLLLRYFVTDFREDVSFTRKTSNSCSFNYFVVFVASKLIAQIFFQCIIKSTD